MTTDEMWYEKTIWITVLLVFIPPFGFLLMWLKAKWNKKTKWIITSLFAIIILVGIISDITADKDVSVKTEPYSTPIVASKEISYEVIKTWEIPNGGFGKVIVISPLLFNEADMTFLGEKLRKDVKSDRNSFVFIFDDKKAAEMRDLVLSQDMTKLTEDDQNYYDKHFIGEYTKNGNSGYHQLTIYFDGVLGSNQKIIKY